MKITVAKKHISATALVSMSDVVFLLLIFLLITSSYITYKGVKITVPKAKATQKEYTKTVTITLTLDDRIYVDAKETNWKDAVAVLKERMVAAQDSIVMIQADQEVPLKKIVSLMDIAKSAGSKRFFIATELPAEEKHVR